MTPRDIGLICSEHLPHHHHVIDDESWTMPGGRCACCFVNVGAESTNTPLLYADITLTCRANKGADPAWDEAVARLRQVYDSRVGPWEVTG